MEEQERLQLIREIKALGADFDQLPPNMRKNILCVYQEIRSREKQMEAARDMMVKNRINHHTIQVATGLSSHTMVDNKYINGLVKKHSCKGEEEAERTVPEQDYNEVCENRDYYKGLWDDFSRQRLKLEKALLVIEELGNQIKELGKKNKALEIVNASRVVDDLVNSINQELDMQGNQPVIKIKPKTKS